jgi:hypothetical protein
MKYIQLTRGYQAVVDDGDYTEMNKYSWHVTGVGYAQRVMAGDDGSWKKQQYTSMHRSIIGAEKGQIVDHINGDTLDNRKVNLRIVTHSQNMRNRRVAKNNTSGCPNVYWQRQKKRWVVWLDIDGKHTYCGSFRELRDAIGHRNKLVIEHYGVYGRVLGI